MSAHSYFRVSDCCWCCVFKYCHTAHFASTFAERLEKSDRRTNKNLEDSSKMVKSGYAAMIKLKNELAEKGQCLFDWRKL